MSKLTLLPLRNGKEIAVGDILIYSVWGTKRESYEQVAAWSTMAARSLLEACTNGTPRQPGVRLIANSYFARGRFFQNSGNSELCEFGGEVELGGNFAWTQESLAQEMPESA